jgi:hypothetical protein
MAELDLETKHTSAIVGARVRPSWPFRASDLPFFETKKIKPRGVG